MPKKHWTDEEIRALPRVTPLIASEYLSNYPNAMSVAVAMREGKLPIWEAIYNPETRRWRYRIHAERLIAYEHGTVPQADLDGLERKMDEFIRYAQDVIEEFRHERQMLMKRRG